MLRAALLAIAVVLAAPAAGSAAACPRNARCSTIQVPLDHSGATPGALPLAYALMPATGTSVGTIAILTGGPGQSAIPLARDVTALLDRIHLDHDLVFVDQRGTGDSGAVKCKDISTPALVAQCAAKLGDKRAFFNTPETAMDLEDLRAKLGVDKLTLIGISYGTKVAGEYARRFPQHTAGVVLDSPVSTDQLDGTFELRQLAMPRMLRDACAKAPCRASVPDAARALRDAVLRLQRAPLKGPFVLKSGRAKTEQLSESTLYGALLSGDESPLIRVFLPAAVQSVAKGDAAPLLHLEALLAGGGAIDEEEDTGINSARLLATSCIESKLPWAPDSPVAGREDAWHAYLAANGTPFAPFKAETVAPFSVASLCAAWPPTPRPASVPAAGPDVPVLVLSGRSDLRTPQEDARRIAAQYPAARFLSVPDVGHSVLTSDTSGCALEAVEAFVDARTVKSCHGGGLSLGAVAYVPATVGALDARRLPGKAGRTLTALRVTITGVALDTALGLALAAPKRHATVPGLRAGFTTISQTRIALHGVEWFRGMRVTGVIDAGDETGHLTVSGPAAAGGTLVLDGDRIRGTLGGRPVRASDFD
jgi:pimeloyl-ACP methyl ester carboxylesterase